MRKFNNLLLIAALAFLFASFTNVQQKSINFGTNASENLSFGLIQTSEHLPSVRSFAQIDTEQRFELRTGTTLPYFEGFESAMVGRDSLRHFGFTTAGTTEITHGVGALVYGGSPISGALGSRSYIFVIPNSTPTVTPNLWIITAGFVLQAGIEYSFEMYVFAPGYQGGRDEFRIGVGNAATEESLSTNILLDRTGANAQVFSDWKRVRVFFTPATTGTFYFGININTPTPGGYSALGFDNIALYEVLDTPIVWGRMRVPEFTYTIAPSFLATPSNEVNDLISIENRYRNNLTNIQANIAVQKNGTAYFNTTASHLGVLAFDANAATLTSAAPLSFNIPTSTTADTYEISISLTSPEGLSRIHSRTIESPILSENILARDNGELSGFVYGNPGINTLFGTTFFISERTVLEAVHFRSAYSYVRIQSDIWIWRLEADNRITLVSSASRFFLDGANEIDTNYTVNLVNNEGQPLIVDPGTYFVFVRQPIATGVYGLRLHGTTTQTNFMAGIVWIDGQSSPELWSTVPYIRLRVSTLPNYIPDLDSNKTQVFMRDNELELVYTEDFTSVAIFNSFGQKVYSSFLSINGRHSISTENLPRGVYIVQFSGKTIENVKVVR